jgi:hypothetical protein
VTERNSGIPTVTVVLGQRLPDDPDNIGHTFRSPELTTKATMVSRSIIQPSARVTMVDDQVTFYTDTEDKSPIAVRNKAPDESTWLFSGSKV